MGSSPKCRLLLPVFLWICAILHRGLSVDLYLQDKTATQSSTYYATDLGINLSASRAIDGDTTTSSHTVCTGNQWWRVDLEAVYCLTRITIVNTHFEGRRLRGAIVRAGLSLDHTQNTQIGDEVTWSQATDGAVIDFTPNSAISARYVSVELSGTCLHIAEVRINADVTTVSLTALGSTSITVNWSSVPVSCAARYNVDYALSNRDRCEPINAPTYTSHCTCTTTSTTITGLLPNSEYTVRVWTNDNGAYGPVISETITTSSVVPIESPTAVAVEMRDKRSLTFTWSLPSCGSRGGGITGYDFKLNSGMINYLNSASGRVTILNLLPFTYYSFEVAARTNDGTGPYSQAINTTTLEAVPTVPRNVHVQSTDNASVSLGWNEPDPPNGRITHYNVQYWRSGDIGTMQTDINVMGLMHRVTGLAAYVAYKAQVQAVTSAGAGLWSIQIDATTMQAAPTVPLNVRIQSTDDMSVSLSWSEPDPPNGRITHYNVRYWRSGDMGTAQTDTNVMHLIHRVVGLAAFVTYTFQVQAETFPGAGPWSDPIMTTTLEAAPAVPLDVQILSTDDASVSLGWSEPDPPNGLILHYNVRYWRSGDMGTMQTDSNVMGLVHSVTGLQASVSYLFDIQAVTSAGPGSWSEPIQATAKIGVPGPIGNLNFTERTETSITLVWDPPLQPRGPITGYKVEYRTLERPYQPDFTAEDTYETNEAQNSPFTITNLKPGTKYEFRVLAKNKMVTGTEHRMLEVYTKPMTDPPAPPKPTPIQERTTDMTVTINLVAPKSAVYIESYVIQVKKAGTLSVTKRDVLVTRRSEDLGDGYIAAEFPKNSLPAEFVVGDSKMYGGYRNAPLQRDAVYNIRVGSVTKGNETEATVTYSEPLTVIVQKPEDVTPSASGNGSTIVAVVAGIIVFVLVIIIVIGSVVWRRQTRQHASNSSLVPRTMELVAKPTTHENDQPRAVNPDGEIYEDVGLPTWARKLEIKWENLIIDDEILGKGNFGEVRAGGVRIRGQVTKAAIKTLKDTDITSDAAMDFKAELKTMVGIKPHPNIVRLLAACFHEGILYVALEFLPNGNLRDYLRSIRPKQKGAGHSTGGASPVTSSNLLKFGTDVAKGMDHLSKTGIIHRDLAARNILLAEDLTAKVSDFGLSRGEDIYVQKSSTRIPVRWLAIESLTRRVYKSKSDVWSFGILLWEIATYGSTPYPGIESKSLAERLLDGYRMPKPDNCADEIYNLMLKCWHEVPSKRPTFKVLCETLEKMNSKSYENVVLSPTVYENFIIKHEYDDN